jgi:c(7)-type cytochrome triheme protein
MKLLGIALLLTGITACPVFAVMPNQSITYQDGSAGPVTFSGNNHRMPCSTCHNKNMFPRMEKGATPITMKAIYAGQLCGACHNGEKAFAAKGNCDRCHQGSKGQ